MAEIVLTPEELNSYKAMVGKNTHVGESKQFVSLVKNAMEKKGTDGTQAKTENWKGSKTKVIESLSKLKPGTLIATFENGKYPSKSTGNHAAIYLESDQTSITVLEQYSSSSGVQIRTIRKKDFDCHLDLDYSNKENKAKKPSNNADCYFPIEQ